MKRIHRIHMIPHRIHRIREIRARCRGSRQDARRIHARCLGPPQDTQDAHEMHTRFTQDSHKDPDTCLPLGSGTAAEVQPATVILVVFPLPWTWCVLGGKT